MAHEFVWQGNHGLACLFVSSVSFWSVSHVFRGLKFVAFLLLLNGLSNVISLESSLSLLSPFLFWRPWMLGEGFLDVFSNLLLNELSFVISLESSLSLLSPFLFWRPWMLGEGFLDVFSNLCASIKYIYPTKKKGIASA